MKDLDSPKKAFEQAKNYISHKGGTIINAYLNDYPNELNSEARFQLLSNSAGSIFHAQSGLIPADQMPTHQSEFTSNRKEYFLEGDSELIVPLSWTGDNGIQVTKNYHFKPNSYIIEVDYDVTNNSNEDKTVSSYKGIRHAKAGRLKLAEEVYKTILKEEPDNVDAMRLLGILATKGGKYKIAEQILIKAIKIVPSYSLLWRNISLVYRLSGQLEKAQKSMDNILALDPKNASVWADYGTILIMLAKYKEAIVAYSRCVSLKPDSPRAYLSLGHAYNTIGNKDKSIESYLNSIKYNSNSGEAYWSLANLKTYSFTRQQIDQMEETLKGDIEEIEKIQLLFALGKAYEGLKEFKTSFMKYKEGNWLKRKSISYSSQDNTDAINKTINFFNKESILK